MDQRLHGTSLGAAGSEPQEEMWLPASILLGNIAQERLGDQDDVTVMGARHRDETTSTSSVSVCVGEARTSVSRHRCWPVTQTWVNSILR